MFGIGEGELVLIVLFAFLIFGPDKLPGMGRTLGRALRQFKSAQEGFTEVVQTNIVDPAAEALSDTPKRPNRNHAAELEEDADLESADGEEAPRAKRAETFAERKKRLAEEKAAREAAEKEAAAEVESDDSDATDAEDAPAQPAPDAADEPQPKKPTAADLYAMTPSSKPRTGGVAGDSPSATHEVSEERSDERGADGALPVVPGAPDDEKEA
ncbi:twin-arginine translocase TatA/TatE family subunit [Olsenella sp. An270]|uniref:Sec-independent protein translocase subunit TatA/TatB n=1 Tax=Olsenella sp. An270 TaxID=1965615 RepID=UPI000B387ED5|nr:twin-arginine translocase TatA/TatE family subunit [Olsenella sp. An270]OUO59855.1 hypothetical protein B5F73_04785 [Olsenella sp. An270]